MNTLAGRTFASLVVCVLLWGAQFAPAKAAIPHLLNYQGYLANSANQPVSGSVTMIFSLYNAPAAPDAEMTPRQPVVASPYAIRSATTEALAAGATVPGSQITGAISTATLPASGLTGSAGAPASW